MRLVLPVGILLTNADATEVGDKTITKVVKILQGMLAKSKEDGDHEREIFAKFQCYCDDNTREKTDSIKSLTTQISVLEAKIEEVQGSSGTLSEEVAKLDEDIAENERARETAESVRDKEHEAYTAFKDDSENALDAMKDAIRTLAEVGADQTSLLAEDSRPRSASFLATNKVKTALSLAATFLPPQAQATMQSFVQAPFTGSYSAQSGQVVGILKNMRDTFEENLASATSAEKAAVEKYDKLMQTLEKQHREMKSSYDKKQEELGENDASLADFRDQLTDAKNAKSDDEEFLAKLEAVCEKKSKQYAERKALRANEDAAVAEAIAILNSDEAFETFGKVDATSTGATSLLQLVSISQHQASNQLSAAARLRAGTSLQASAGSLHSMRLAKVAALLAAGNPFETVLAEIDKMLEVIVEEGKVDKENLDWCNDERTENHESLDDKIDQISTLQGAIDDLTDAIENPESGLKIMIEQTQESLKDNVEAQVKQTKNRKEENKAYQQNIRTLVKAEEILRKAIKVLNKYYESLEKHIAEQEGAGLLQEDPAPPETFGTFKGQSSKGGDAIQMLEFILDETVKEEREAHADEESAQHDYEDSMKDLKAKEEEGQKTIVELQTTLTSKEEELDQKNKDLKETEADKESIEAYLAKIKPGCDFITKHFDARERNRETETTALNNAKDLLKDTPAYKTAKAKEHEEGFGKCKEPCTEDEEHVECKACMADVTIPGYCAGHKGTPGC
jgi:chromosome segregation ATPase